MQMTVNVFNHNNGVIHKQTQRKNQRKQRDPVDRLISKQANRQHDEQDQRDVHRHDRCLAPAQKQQQNHDHGCNGDTQMLDKQVHRRVRAFAGVSRDVDTHIVGNQVTLQLIQLGFNAPGHKHRVRAPFLGQRNRHGWRFGLFRRHRTLRRRTKPDAVVLTDFRRPILDRGNVPQIDRFVLPLADNQRPYFLRILQVAIEPDPRHLIVPDQRADGAARIGACEDPMKLVQRDPVSGQTGWIDLDQDFVVLSADDIRHGHALERRQLLPHALGQALQRQTVHIRRGKRNDRNRHVIDIHGLDQGLGSPRRDAVQIVHDAVVKLDQAGFLVLADLEHHGHHANRIHGSTKGMVNAGHLAQYHLQRTHDQVLHLFRACPLHLHDHIGRRHVDLRILLARRDHQGHDTNQENQCTDDGGQIRAHGRPTQAARDIQWRIRFAHDDLRSTCTPVFSSDEPQAITSPGFRPARTSTLPS